MNLNTVDRRVVARYLLIAGAVGSTIVAVADMIMVGQFVSGRITADRGLDLLIGKTRLDLRVGAFLGLPGFLLQIFGFSAILLLANDGRR